MGYGWLGVWSCDFFIGEGQKGTPKRDGKKNVRKCSEGVSTGVWCVPGFGAGFEFALEPSKLQKQGENPGKGRFYNLRQTLVCTKPWFKRDLKCHDKPLPFPSGPMWSEATRRPSHECPLKYSKKRETG